MCKIENKRKILMSLPFAMVKTSYLSCISAVNKTPQENLLKNKFRNRDEMDIVFGFFGENKIWKQTNLF